MITHPWKVLAARTGAAVLMTVGLIVGVAGVPATAQSTPVNYTVLGDSFSAGTGGGDESGPCLQSPNGYGNVYAAATGRTLANLACFGATTEQVRNEQIPLIPTSTTLVTLTVGANDVGSGALAEACTAAPQSPACTTALASSLSQLRSLPAKIKATVKAIKAKVPTAKVVLLGYPRLFEPNTMAAAGYSPEQVSTATTMNVATDLVNGVLRFVRSAPAQGLFRLRGPSMGMAFRRTPRGSSSHPMRVLICSTPTPQDTPTVMHGPCGSSTRCRWVA